MFDVLSEIRDLLESELGAEFKHYWVGKVHTVPINYLPLLMVYGETTELINPHTTCRDRTHHVIKIEIVTNGYGQVTNDNNITKIQKAQKEIWNKMEERDDSQTPKSTSILGILRRNMSGGKYLFIDNISIKYPIEPPKTEDKTYYRGIMTITAHREFTNRS